MIAGRPIMRSDLRETAYGTAILDGIVTHRKHYYLGTVPAPVVAARRARNRRAGRARRAGRRAAA